MDEPLDPEATAPARDDEMAAYLRSLANGPVSPRPPIVVTDIALPPLTQFFSESPAAPPSAGAGGASTAGEGLAAPTEEGDYYYAVDSEGVGTWTAMDTVDVVDCSSGSSVTRKVFVKPTPP